MKNISENNIFNEPEGYFDKLPEDIIKRRNKQVTQVYLMRTAVAAILLIGLSFMFVIYQPQEPTYQAVNEVIEIGIDDEVELYISSGLWQAEDVLLLSDDPNSILDEIIEMEYMAYMPDPDPMDDDFWF